MQIATLWWQVKNTHYFTDFPIYFSPTAEVVWVNINGGGVVINYCCPLARPSCAAGIKGRASCTRYGTREQRYRRKREMVSALQSWKHRDSWVFLENSIILDPIEIKNYLPKREKRAYTTGSRRCVVTPSPSWLRSFYRWGNWQSKKVSDLTSGRVGTWTHISFLCLFLSQHHTELEKQHV